MGRVVSSHWQGTAQRSVVKVLGLTGGVGMGKSASAQHLRARSVPVVDTDDLARQVVEPGQAALTEVQQAFGTDFVGPDGQLRREELARRVFADPAARKRLEDILHPRIRALWRAQVEAWRAEGRPLAAVVIPLLFETSAEAELDATICVACTAATQHQRLLARGWSPNDIEQRIRAQWPIEVKIARANYVVWTEAGLDVHGDQLDRILLALEPTWRNVGTA
jgi:dephospho-CoA kinase